MVVHSKYAQALREPSVKITPRVIRRDYCSDPWLNATNYQHRMLSYQATLVPRTKIAIRIYTNPPRRWYREDVDVTTGISGKVIPATKDVNKKTFFYQGR